MRTFILGTFMLCVMTIASAMTKTERGNGNIITKNITVAEYTGISLSCAVNYNGDWIKKIVGNKKSSESPRFEYSQQGGKASLEITMDENLFSLLDITTTGAELRISVKKGYQIEPSKMRMKATSKDLNALSSSSIIDFKLKGPFSTDRLSIRVSGAGDIDIMDKADIAFLKVQISGASDVKAKNLSCDTFEGGISGAGDLTLKGMSNKASYEVSGSGDVSAMDFKVKDVICRVSGAGDLDVYASDNLDISVSGSGDVTYKGEPRVKSKVSGFGDVRKAK